MNEIDLSQYRQDAKGNLIPIKNIKQIDLARDDFVREAIAKMRPVQKLLSDLKREIMADVHAFIDMSVEQYGAQRSVKGNATLYSYDGKYKISIAMQDKLHFDERIYAAKTLIDECLNEWSENSSSELKLIVQSAFDVDKEGKINTAKVLALRRHDIKHEKWQRAMQAISDSVHIQTTREYVRFYERDDETQEYVMINLDFAKV